MTQNFTFNLVSPEEKLFSEDVTMAVLPGEVGDFGVLSGHAPLVATVKAGVVEIYRENRNKVSEKIFVAGGFADVTGDQCTLLAEQAVNVNDLDAADLEKQLKQARTDLELAEEDADKRRFQKRIDTLQAMLATISD